MLPNIASWAQSQIDGALAAAGTSASQVGLDKLAGNGVIYHGLQLFGGGGTLAGLMLGAIAAFIIDRKFDRAALYALAAAVLAFFGFINGTALAVRQFGAGRARLSADRADLRGSQPIPCGNRSADDRNHGGRTGRMTAVHRPRKDCRPRRPAPAIPTPRQRLHPRWDACWIKVRCRPARPTSISSPPASRVHRDPRSSRAEINPLRCVGLRRLCACLVLRPVSDRRILAAPRPRAAWRVHPACR